MKHYKDPATNELYAYAEDDSQDAWIKPGLVLIESAEAEQIRQAHLAPLIAARQASAVDPVQKLAQFLRFNPDVQQMLNRG
jgi:hypothetical protein